MARVPISMVVLLAGFVLAEPEVRPLLSDPARIPYSKPSFKTYLFKVLGFGNSEGNSPPPSIIQGQLPMQAQFPGGGGGGFGPCGIPYTTTTASPILCPFPPLGPLPSTAKPTSTYPVMPPRDFTTGRPQQTHQGDQPFDPILNPKPIGPNPPLTIYPTGRPGIFNPDPVFVGPDGTKPPIFTPSEITTHPPSVVSPSSRPRPGQFGEPTGVDPSQTLPPFIPGGGVTQRPGPGPFTPPRPVDPTHPSRPGPGPGPGPGPVNPPGPGPVVNPVYEPPNIYEDPLPCGALRPFIPSGFSYASAVNYSVSQCPLMNPMLRNGPPCTMLDSLSFLGLNKFRSLVYNSGLDLMFLRTSGYTLFAPLDIAFSKLPQWIVRSLESDKNLQLAFVLNHLVKDDLPLRSLKNEDLILNARPGDNRVRVNIYHRDFPSPIYSVDGARIVRGDLRTATGRIHITEKVIMPNPPRYATEYLSERTELESYWNILKRSRSVKQFQLREYPITLLIPVNQAVDRMMDDLRRRNETLDEEHFIDYHTINGTYYAAGLVNNQFLVTNYLDIKEIKMGVGFDGYGKYLSTINGQIRVLKSDIPLLNGVAHIIDECVDTRSEFFSFDEMDEFDKEYGVISKRSMKVTGDEKELNF